MIDTFVSNNPRKAVSFASMGQTRYLSAMKHVAAVVGNSSSGITEAPSLRTPTVNIGDRQKGRVRAKSVIDCSPDKEAIGKALAKAFSPIFRRSLQSISNPYQKENTSKTIKEILKSHRLDNILKKEFHEIS